MPRLLGACLVLLSVAASGSAQTTLKTARERWLRGNYDEALEQYEKLARDAKLRTAIPR